MYCLLPVSGAVIAVIFFLLAYSGLYTVQGTGSFILVGLAAMVGMFSPQATEKLKMIAEGLLTHAPQGANTVAPQPTGEARQACWVGGGLDCTAVRQHQRRRIGDDPTQRGLPAEQP